MQSALAVRRQDHDQRAEQEVDQQGSLPARGIDRATTRSGGDSWAVGLDLRMLYSTPATLQREVPLDYMQAAFTLSWAC